MRRVLKWTIAGIVVPIGLLLTTFVPVAIARGVDELVSNVGMLTSAVVILAVPGAAVGALVGLFDQLLASYISRGPSKHRVRLATAAMSASLFAGTLLLLGFTAGSGLGVLHYFAIGLCVAAIPAVVANRRFRVLGRAQAQSL